jgi:hypothetical protein
VTRALTAAVAVAVLLAASAATALGAGKQEFVGVVYPFPDRCALGHDRGACLSTEDLDRLEAARVANVRWGLSWSQVEPRRGIYNWRVPDRMIGAFANRGIRVLPVVRGVPPWASKTPEILPLGRKRAKKGWRAFLTAAAARYGRGGVFWNGPYRLTHPGAAPEPIKVWQIWSEENNTASRMHMKPRRYARLVRLSRRAIRTADHRAKILLGGMPGYVHSHAWRYLRRLYEIRGFKRRFDAVALHPYSPDVRHVFVQIKRVRRAMRRQHDGPTPLWISELGWGSHPPDGHGINQGRKGQSRLLRKTFTALKHKRARWHLKRAYWFNWRDPQRPSMTCSFCATSGLLRFNQRPKPAWHAFTHVTGAHG